MVVMTVVALKEGCGGGGWFRRRKTIPYSMVCRMFAAPASHRRDLTVTVIPRGMVIGIGGDSRSQWMEDQRCTLKAFITSPA